MAGYEASEFETIHFNLTGTSFPIDVARSMNLATGSFNTTDRFNVYQSRLLSQFGRFNYNFSEKYFFEANIRRDASAPKFGPANIWGIFPSFSAGWMISREEFFKNIPFINTLKLRASTGKLGSDNIGSYIYLKTYTSQFTSYAFDQNGQNKVTGFFISKFPNEEVKWEEVNMNNIGINLTAFENKLSFSADYYIKDTKDLLYGVPIPPSVGIAVHNFSPVNPELNIGKLRNTGVDLELGYKWLFSRFSLSLTGNSSFLKNEMQSLSKGQYIIAGDGGGQIGGMTRTEAGKPISSFYGYQVQQILNSPADVYAVNTWSPDGIYQEGGTGPGDFMYKDISGPGGVSDGKVTAEYDRTFIGNPWPKMIYGLNVLVVYNKFIDLSLQFQGVQGVDIFNADKAYTRNFFGDNNTTTKIYEAWTPEKPTGHPRNIASDPNGNFGKPSDYFVEDGSYLKLRNLQVGINVPAHILSRFHLPKMRVYFNANNLLTITRYSGLDPEIAGTNISRGVDYGLYPMVRTIMGGIELSF
jgi:TonB-linked SusC/RagA family outer membrane protein